MRVVLIRCNLFHSPSVLLQRPVAGTRFLTSSPVGTCSWGVTKHRNGMERNGIYRNKPEYTGTRRNDAGMDKNGTGMYRNEPE